MQDNKQRLNCNGPYWKLFTGVLQGETSFKNVWVSDNFHNKTVTDVKVARGESQHWSFSLLSYQSHQLSSWLPASVPVSLALEAGTIWRSTLVLIGLCWIDWTNQRRDWQGQKVSSSIRWWVFVLISLLCCTSLSSIIVCFSASLCTAKSSVLI